MRLKNQENEEFYKKQTITLVEIPKFLTEKYHSDNSMLAQWLRVIDGLNNEQPLPVPEGSMFAHLHECAKLSIFTKDFLISEAKNMSDRNYELYVEKKRSRAEGRAEGEAEAEKRANDRAAKRIDYLRSMGVPEEIIVGVAAIK